MYPPPQNDVVIHSHSRPVSGELASKLGFEYIRSQMKQHSHPPPFSYEYVLEDGKMPMLAEFHAVERKSTAGVLRSSSTRSATNSQLARRPVPINRSSSYNKPGKETLSNDNTGHESTAEKLKRAFSLSSGRTSALPSRQPSTASRPERADTTRSQPSNELSQSQRLSIAPFIVQDANARHSSPPSESRVPSLILPTPTPSPRLPNSASSSPQNTPMNFGLPNHNIHSSNRPFSWAYNDDITQDDEEDEFDDITFLQKNGMGRLYLNSKPQKQFRKEKAFELLGIASKDKSLHRKPTVSTATSSHHPSPAASDRDPFSRVNSKRNSQDYRHRESSQSTQADYAGSHGNQISTPKASPSASWTEEDTPRPARHNRHQEPRKPLSSSISKPLFVRNAAASTRPKPIVVPRFPVASSAETHSAPPILLNKLNTPTQAANGRLPLVLAEPQPLPVSVAKVSRFIEHLDANAKRLSLSISHTPALSPTTAAHPIFLEQRSLSDPDMIAPAPRRATSPMPFTLRAVPGSSGSSSSSSSSSNPRMSHAVKAQAQIEAVAGGAVAASRPVAAAERELSLQSGVRRSASMRESASGPWGAVVCTAQARPIVATGHAKMV